MYSMLESIYTCANSSRFVFESPKALSFAFSPDPGYPYTCSLYLSGTNMLSEGSNAMKFFCHKLNNEDDIFLSLIFLFLQTRSFPIFNPFSRLVFFPVPIDHLFSHRYKSEGDLNVETLQLSTFFAVLRRLYQHKMLLFLGAFRNSLDKSY